MPIRYFKLAYAVISASWLAYVARMVTAPCPNCNPHISAAIYCFFLIGAIPASIGYALLFLLLPWASSRMRHS